MSRVIETLVEMGFAREKAELAIKKTGTDDIHSCMEWLLAHNDDEPLLASNSDITPTATSGPIITSSSSSASPEKQEREESDSIPPAPVPESSSQQLQAKSLKCNDCGKLFRTQEEIEFHASKSGHDDFSESSEEKRPLSEEEKKEQLAKIEAKLRQRRLDREVKEKEEAVEKERNRIRSGKELLEAKKKQEELEMKKIVEQKKREKEEERMARQRVREQIEQDKLARKAKYSNQEMSTTQTPISTSVVSKPAIAYSEVQLQIRLTNGSSIVQTFGAKEPLSAVRVFVELNRKDGSGPFSLMTNYPRRVFGPEDYDMPLETLGLAPRATIIVSKS